RISGASGSLAAISDNPFGNLTSQIGPSVGAPAFSPYDMTLPEVPGGASSYGILPFPQARGQSGLSLQPFPNVPAAGSSGPVAVVASSPSRPIPIPVPPPPSPPPAPPAPPRPPTAR